MKPVTTPGAPKPGGHYSQAIVHDGLVYVAGQLPIDPATSAKELGSIEDQTRLVLGNAAAVLAAAGSSLAQVLKVTVYISDIELWGRVNAVYAEVFGEHRPARSVVPVKELHYGFKIEVDMIAAVARSAGSSEAEASRGSL
jgi:2-iminobutanoate/2-iminopropanoate deaminase